jgi:histidyl-tRNA synthetase
MTVPQDVTSVIDVFIVPMGDAALRHAGVIARDLRRAGTSVEVGAGMKIKRAMEIANKVGARYAVILGDNEIAAGVYTLKNMLSTEQRQVTREELFNTIGNRN